MQDINSIINAFKSSNNNPGSGNYYLFYKMNDNEQARIRFLPDKNEENRMGFLVEKVMHRLTINGEIKTVPCLSMYGESCPICAVSQQFYKREGDQSPNGKKYWKKKQHVGQVLVLEDPLPADPDTKENQEGKVLFVTIGFQLFNIIKSAIERGDLDEVPFAYNGGYDFIIAKTAQGKNDKGEKVSTYALGSNFARKATSLDPDTIAMCKENIVDLSTLLPSHPGTEKIEAMLESALTGTDYEEESSSDSLSAAVSKLSQRRKEVSEAEESTSDVEEAAEKNKAEDVVVKSPKAEPEPKSEPVVEDSEDEDEDDILAKIKRRRAQKNS